MVIKKENETVVKKEKKGKGCCGSKEQGIKQIPSEIIVEEILWRLPVKPLLRFRSVCTSWNSLIAFDPKFATLQLKNSIKRKSRQRIMIWDCGDDHSSAFFFLEQNQKALLPNKSFAIEKINTTSPIEDKGSSSSSIADSSFAIEKINTTSPIKKGKGNSFSIVASCDGLVCLHKEMSHSILFWNPVTGETKKASQPPIPIPCFLDCVCTYGLGYDSSTDDYKLVWITLNFDNFDDFDEIMSDSSSDDQHKEVRVYSLRTDSWRQIQDFPYEVLYSDPGVFVNGALYWTGYCKDSPKLLKVVSFDLEKEEFRLLDLPEAVEYQLHGFDTGIGVLDDKLCVYYPSNMGGCSLLLIDEYDNGDSCTKHTVTLQDGMWFTPLCLLKNGEEVLLRVRGHKLGVYHLQDGTFRHLQILGMPKTFQAVAFSESLISPNTFKGMNN